jgi:hypothetical protein
MAEIKIKSNGLRNELKEIRKSIDKLTEVLLLQTNKRYEINNNTTCCNDDELCKCKKREVD